MNILITGGVGRVGRPLAMYLSERGHNIHVIDNHPAENTEIPSAVCDINDIAAIRPHLKGIDAIIHLAGIPGPFYGREEIIFQVNGKKRFSNYGKMSMNIAASPHREKGPRTGGAIIISCMSSLISGPVCISPTLPMP